MSDSRSLLAVAVIIVLIGGGLYYLSTLDTTPPPEEVTVNGFKFTKNGTIWTTRVNIENQRYDVDFRYNPTLVSDIPINGVIDERFQQDTVYLTIDPSTERTEANKFLTLAAVEVAAKLTTPFERTVVGACTRNESLGCIGRPIVTCEDRDLAVVYMKLDNTTKIELDGNCVTIQGQGDDIVRAADFAIFRWLGIS